MRHYSGSLVTSDGLTLYSESWLPGEDSCGVVVLAHGYAEHVGRYAPLAARLTGRGFALQALDLRGHGHSEGERANVGTFQAYVNDLHRFLDITRGRHPDVPFFLLGHSMGGAVAAMLVIQQPQMVDGLLLSAPFLRNAAPVPPLLETLARPIARLLPSLPTQPLDARLISRDPAIVEAYDGDPLVYRGKIKARMGVEMLAAGPWILARAADIHLPVLVMHGTADGLAAVSGSEELYQGLGSSDKTFELYQGSYHEILNDLDRERVMSDIIAWLERQVTGGRSVE